MHCGRISNQRYTTSDLKHLCGIKTNLTNNIWNRKVLKKRGYFVHNTYILILPPCLDLGYDDLLSIVYHLFAWESTIYMLVAHQHISPSPNSNKCNAITVRVNRFFLTHPAPIKMNQKRIYPDQGWQRFSLPWLEF